MSKQQKQTSGPEKLCEKNSKTSFVKKTWEEERFKGTWMWKGKELLRSGRNKQKKPFECSDSCPKWKYDLHEWLPYMFCHTAINSFQ